MTIRAVAADVDPLSLERHVCFALAAGILDAELD
jgi:hypothetical protein